MGFGHREDLACTDVGEAGSEMGEQAKEGDETCWPLWGVEAQTPHGADLARALTFQRLQRHEPYPPALRAILTSSVQPWLILPGPNHTVPALRHRSVTVCNYNGQRNSVRTLAAL